MTPPSSASVAAPARPFRFQARREPVDWRGLGALSMERVVSEVDVEALQRHVNAVTFCSVEAERCERCQAAVDPALLKLFRLAQLTVEWLLHCQAYLARNLQATEERVEAAERGREQLASGQKALEEAQRAQLAAQRDKSKAAQRRREQKTRELLAELEQREKIIRTQQSMFAPGVISNRKCPHCDKSFINAGFLQNHMQRRHPDEYDTQLQSDSDSRLQMENLRKENVDLKEQLIQQQQTLLLKAEQEKEHQCKYNELQKELEHLKALEAAWRREDSRDRRDREDSRDRRREDRRREDSRDRDNREDSRDREEVDRELQTHAIFKLEQQLKEQDRKWESRMQEIKVQHESEKDQDRKWESRMQEMEDQHESEKSQWWDEHRQRSDRMKELERKLREKENTIAAQREQMKKISSNPPPAKSAKTPPVILTAPAPEPKAKRVLLDSSSISERPVAKKRSERSEVRRHGVMTANALRRNHPNIRKELRPVLENALMEKMEHLGVKGQRGLSSKQLRSILARLHSDRENTARSTPDYWLHREAVSRALEARVRQGARDQHQGTRDHHQGARDHQGTRDSHPTEPRARRSPQASQSRPQTGGLRSGHVTQVVQQVVRTPQPAPRARTGPAAPTKTSTPHSPAPTKTSTPHSYKTATPKTSPFSSEDESEEEDEASLGGPASKPAGPASKPAGPASKPAGPASKPGGPASKPGGPASKLGGPTSKLGGPASILGGPASRQQTQAKQQATPPGGAVTQTAVTTLESEEEWSDEGAELQELRLPPPQTGTNRRTGDRPRAVEQGVGDRGHKRPAGGVRVLPDRKDVVQELMCTDLEDCSDWVSSLEDEASKALKKSLDSSSTSVWGASTERNQRSGPTDAGTTGSTLKSSLVSLSDLSDSEDI